MSEDSAFAYAANAVLTALTGRSFGTEAQRASAAAVADGIDVPAGIAAGRALGERAGKLALAQLSR